MYKTIQNELEIKIKGFKRLEESTKDFSMFELVSISQTNGKNQ